LRRRPRGEAAGAVGGRNRGHGLLVAGEAGVVEGLGAAEARTALQMSEK
jgi:hypothetical protein